MRDLDIRGHRGRWLSCIARERFLDIRSYKKVYIVKEACSTAGGRVPRQLKSLGLDQRNDELKTLDWEKNSS